MLRRIIGWLEKLKNMDTDRLPRICLEQMISNRKDPSNWLSRLFDIFHRRGIAIQDDVEYILQNKHNLLIDYENKLMENDWFAFLNCKNLTIGIELNVRKIDCNYFNLNLDLRIKRIMAQIRLAVKKYSKIYINGKTLSFDDEKPCLMCNLPNSWTLEHLLVDCINTTTIIQQTFPNLYIDRDCWIDIINSNNHVTIRKFLIILYRITEFMQQNNL